MPLGASFVVLSEAVPEACWGLAEPLDAILAREGRRGQEPGTPWGAGRGASHGHV